MKERILVSACLLGCACRYDGDSRPNSKIIALKEKYELIPFCPEIYGGLPTPRTPSERVGDKVLMYDGCDVTENYKKGANEALELCKLLEINRAVLKAHSPSCGKNGIYDGSFTGILTEGKGVTAELLLNQGIEVLDENEIIKL